MKHIARGAGIVKTRVTSHDNAQNIVMGKNTITFPYDPPASKEVLSGRSITRLGGTVICDKKYVENTVLISEVDETYVDEDGNGYQYNPSKDEFTLEDEQ